MATGVDDRKMVLSSERIGLSSTDGALIKSLSFHVLWSEITVPANLSFTLDSGKPYSWVWVSGGSSLCVLGCMWWPGGKRGHNLEGVKISRWVFGARHLTSIKVPPLPSVFRLLVGFICKVFCSFKMLENIWAGWYIVDIIQKTVKLKLGK